jgi:hypothetical protein
MSEQTNEEPQGLTPEAEPEWPTTCPYCGTHLETGIVQVIPDSDSEHFQSASPATVIEQDFCPNPDCPGRSDQAEPIDAAQ